MVAVVDTLDLKYGSGNRQLVLLVQLLNGQIGELLVFGRHRDCAAAIDNSLIHMGADGRGQLGIGGGGGHFNEGIHALRDIGDRDLAGGICGFRADQLAVLKDVENRAGERPVGIIQFDELDFYLGIVLKNKGYIRLSIPVEFLPHLAGIFTEGITVGGRHFRCHIASHGHGIPRHITQSAASASGVGAGKVIINAGNFDDRAGKATAGVICIDFADITRCRDAGRIGKGDGHAIAGAIGEDDIFRAGIIDSIAVRGSRFCDGIGAGIQRGQGIGPIRAGDDVLGEGAVLGFNVEFRTRQSLGGVGGVHLLDRELVLFLGDVHSERTDYNSLHGIRGMGTGAGACERILVHIALTPHAAVAEVEDILRSVPERGAVAGLVDAGVIRVFERVPDIHQFLGTGSHGITEGACLVAPDDGLHPGIHIPGILRSPYVIHAEGMGFVGEGAGGVGIVVGHHHLDGGIGDGLGISPCLSDQGLSHAAALGSAETNGGLAAVVVVHLMQRTGTEACRLIRNAGHAEALQFDRIGTGREGGCREKSEHTNQRKQQCRHAGLQRMPQSFHRADTSFLFVIWEQKKSLSAVAERPGQDENIKRRDYWLWDCRRTYSSRSCRRSR